MSRRVLLFALGAAAVAVVVSVRRRALVGHPAGNGGPSRRTEELRQRVAGARERLRAAHRRTREQQP